MGLKMKTACEICGKEVPSDSGNAYICSSERTYCGADAQDSHYNSPRCGGELVHRPRESKKSSE